jgi:hypothetical protein
MSNHKQTSMINNNFVAFKKEVINLKLNSAISIKHYELVSSNPDNHFLSLRFIYSQGLL